MNADSCHLIIFIFYQDLTSPSGGPLKETVFAFKRNMRGFCGVKPPVH